MGNRCALQFVISRYQTVKVPNPTIAAAYPHIAFSVVWLCAGLIAFSLQGYAYSL